MLAKLCIVILTVTLTAASMLTVRQQRLDAVYDMRRSLEAAASLDRKLQEVRIDIARRVTPDSVVQLAGSLGPMEPIPAEWSDPLLTVLTASYERPAEEARSAQAQIAREPELDHAAASGPETPDHRDLGPGFTPREEAR